MQELLDDYRDAVYELALAEHLQTTDWDEIYDRVNALRAKLDAMIQELQS